MSGHRVLIFGGCTLAFGAAFANTGLVLHTGTSVSHLTGDISRFTIGLAHWSPEAMADVLSVATAACSFLLGALLAGFAVHHPSIDYSRPYGRSITGIGLLFIIASFAVHRWAAVGIGLAAFGCGLQNALATHYRGVVLRTTHLTGMFTDFGTSLGMRLRGHDIPLWKIAIPFLLMLSFFAGGLSAAISELLGFDAILSAGIAYTFAGLAWSIWKRSSRGTDPFN